ncbi:hypothetical protein QKU48_gp1139 [Fadolivirus algeromassiliense]|jgi:hypothetical protein|uniref:Uncharacterized protein n=1 Tax=Fadolivirus FV1/VV64 TaxID=3070911 RepID=A0A7D3V949_9VIRU|nr:hypothetical protein QKU48_gp1139 [Fadolivirus algeromassiliense]QKF94597.1 hypothetical protein Fadolivirus_1_1139 [Fadolivirus FV1/VV64]
MGDNKVVKVRSQVPYEENIPLEVLKQYLQTTTLITIQSEKYNDCGKIPSIQLKYLKWFDGMSNTSFSEGLSKKNVVRLLDGYDDEKTKFFCYVMNKIPFDNMEFTHKELVWFCGIIDDYLMNKQIADYYINQIDEYNLGWNVIAEIAKLYSASMMGDTVNKLFTQTKNIVMKNQYPVIPYQCFTFSRSRQIVCEFLKTYEFNNEIDLINMILKGIADSHNTEYTLSLKAIYDLIACVRWFYVDKDFAISRLADIKALYPDFQIPERVLTACNLRKSLVDNYNYKVKGVFKYNPEKIGQTCIPRTNNSYSTILKNMTRMRIYTTTFEPTIVNFSINIASITKSKRRRVHNTNPYIMITQNIYNEDKDKVMCGKFTITNLTKNIEVCSKLWSFRKSFIVKIDSPDDEYKISFSMVYPVGNDDPMNNKQNDKIMS